MKRERSRNFIDLDVRNFGPIKECAIDVRPLTVFVGPSNTGKSFLAILIYALHKYFNFENRRRPYSSIQRMFNHAYGNQSKPTLARLKSSIQQSALEAETNDREGDIDTRMTLLEPAMEVIKTMFEGERHAVSKEIERCFGISVNELVRYRSKGDASFNVRVKNGSSSQPFQFNYNLRNQSIKAECPPRLSLGLRDRESLNDFKMATAFTLEQIDEGEFDRGYFFWNQFSRLFESITRRFLGNLRFPAYYLPADRTGIMHAHAMVVSSLIERAAMSGLRPDVNTPLLSGVLADFLEQLIVKKQSRLPRSRSKSSSEIASDVEDLILGGSIEKKRAEVTDYPEFVFLPNKWKKAISLINASSMVSELAPVVLYLREHVSKGDFLIVEEPESHLHPAKQVEFMRLIAKLVESDVQVIVTTHSEWLVEELANIVQRSKLHGTSNLFVSEDRVSLPADEVGVWLFQDRSRSKSSTGSIVKEIKLNDSGLYPTEYDRIAQQLHNEWAALSSGTGGVG